MTRGGISCGLFWRGWFWALLSALVACGDDSTGPDEDSLTREEALALVKAATSPGFEVITENSALEGEILDLRSLIQEEFTAPCLMGGRRRFRVPVDDHDTLGLRGHARGYRARAHPERRAQPGHKSRTVHHGRPWVRLERRGGWYGSLGHGRRSERILPDRSGHRGGDRPNPGSLRPSPGRHVELNSQSQTRGCSASDEYGARTVATVDDILAPPPDL